MQAKRFLKRRKYLARVKRISKILSNAITCPLGPQAIQGYNRANFEFDRLRERDKQRISRRMTREYERYHTPITIGRDGREYSAYDMDMAMMGY